MTIERMVTALAGIMILISLILAVKHNDNWLWLTAFIGFNLLQSSFTGFCPPAMIFKKMGFKSGQTYK